MNIMKSYNDFKARCEEDFWYYPKRIFAFCLAVFSIMSVFDGFMVIPAHAETGSISVNTAQVLNYQDPTSGSTAIANPDFTKLIFASSSYNTIVNFTVVPALGDTTFPAESNVTTFTITSGGTGTGVASYSKALNKFSWTFSQDTQITSSPIILSYDSNIYSGFSFASSTTGTDCAVSASKPLGIQINAAGTKCWAITGTSHFVQYAIDVSTQATDTYNITYPVSGFFSFVVGKSGTVSTKAVFHSQSNNTQSYYPETTFNTNNFSGSAIQSDGIYLNISLSGGQFNDVLINASGAVNINNNTTPGVGGSNSGQIYYDYTNPYIGNAYGINVSVNASSQAPFNTYYIFAYDPSGLQIDGSPIIFTSNTYNTSRLWQFAVSGKYNASLKACNAFDLSCSNTFKTGLHELDVASLDVVSQQFAYKVSTDADNYFTGQIINITANNPSFSTVYVSMFLSVGGQNPIIDMPIPAKTNKSFNFTVNGEMALGQWEIAMYTAKNSVGKVSNDIFNITMPNAGDRVSVRWGDQNFVGRTNVLHYATNANSSTVKVYHPIPSRNTSTLLDTFSVFGGTDGQKDYIMDVAGSWNASIVDDGNPLNVSYANMTVLGNTTFGCDQRRPDYICFDKQSYVPGEKFTINYKATDVPGIENGQFIYEHDFTLRAVMYDPEQARIVTKTIVNVNPLSSISIPLSGSFNGYFTKSAAAGTYHATLVLDGTNASDFLDGTQLADGYAIVVINVPDANQTVPANSLGARDIIDGWTAMFNMGINDASRLLFAVIVIMLFTASGFMLTGKNATGGIIFGFMPYAFFAFIAYIPLWITVVLVLVVAIKLRWFS